MFSVQNNIEPNISDFSLFAIVMVFVSVLIFLKRFYFWFGICTLYFLLFHAICKPLWRLFIPSTDPYYFVLSYAFDGYHFDWYSLFTNRDTLFIYERIHYLHDAHITHNCVSHIRLNCNTTILLFEFFVSRSGLPEKKVYRVVHIHIHTQIGVRWMKRETHAHTCLYKHMHAASMIKLDEISVCIKYMRYISHVRLRDSSGEQNWRQQ